MGLQRLNAYQSFLSAAYCLNILEKYPLITVSSLANFSKSVLNVLLTVSNNDCFAYPDISIFFAKGFAEFLDTCIARIMR